VARGEQHALEQRRADAVALPIFFDAEGGFRLRGERAAERAQFAGAAQGAVDEETVDHGFQADREVDVAADELVRYPAAEPVAPAFAVETQQVVAVKLGFTDPQLADHSA